MCAGSKDGCELHRSGNHMSVRSSWLEPYAIAHVWKLFAYVCTCCQGDAVASCVCHGRVCAVCGHGRCCSDVREDVGALWAAWKLGRGQRPTAAVVDLVELCGREARWAQSISG